MPNFDALISRLNADYPQHFERGTAFERVCKWFLKQDPYYGQEFRNVWLWDEWPDRWGPDLGIDLVAETVAGKLVAVQAKCYADTVPLDEIDKFISASSRPEFAQRLLIATSGINRNAEYKLTHQDKPSPFLLGYQLRDWPVDWLAASDASRSARLTPKTPYPYQQTVVDDVVQGFKSADRGKVGCDPRHARRS
jgi:predicted helicase